MDIFRARTSAEILEEVKAALREMAAAQQAELAPVMAQYHRAVEELRAYPESEARWQRVSTLGRERIAIMEAWAQRMQPLLNHMLSFPMPGLVMNEAI